MRRFVIVVDMQRDFVMPSGALPVPGADALTAPMQAWLARLQPAETAGILMTFDTHDPAAYAGSAEGAEFPLHCIRDTPGWESVLDPAVIDPAIPLYRLEKHVFDMWAEPDLLLHDVRRPDAAGTRRDGHFRALIGQGVDTVTVVGVAADYCVRWAVDGLIARGFTVDLPARLTRGIQQDAAQVIADHFPTGVAISD